MGLLELKWPDFRKVQELLLTMGLSDDNIGMESGEMLIRFSIGRAVMMPLAADRFEGIEMDLPD